MGDEKTTRGQVWLNILSSLLQSTDVAVLKSADELAKIADKLEDAYTLRFFDDGSYRHPLLDLDDEAEEAEEADPRAYVPAPIPNALRMKEITDRWGFEQAKGTPDAFSRGVQEVMSTFGLGLPDAAKEMGTAWGVDPEIIEIVTRRSILSAGPSGDIQIDECIQEMRNLGLGDASEEIASKYWMGRIVPKQAGPTATKLNSGDVLDIIDKWAKSVDLNARDLCIQELVAGGLDLKTAQQAVANHWPDQKLLTEDQAARVVGRWAVSGDNNARNKCMVELKAAKFTIEEAEQCVDRHWLDPLDPATFLPAVIIHKWRASGDPNAYSKCLSELTSRGMSLVDATTSMLKMGWSRPTQDPGNKLALYEGIIKYWISVRGSDPEAYDKCLKDLTGAGVVEAEAKALIARQWYGPGPAPAPDPSIKPKTTTDIIAYWKAASPEDPNAYEECCAMLMAGGKGRHEAEQLIAQYWHGVEPAEICPGCKVICSEATMLKSTAHEGKLVCPSCAKLSRDTEALKIISKWNVSGAGNMQRLMCLKQLRREMKLTTPQAEDIMDTHWKD